MIRRSLGAQIEEIERELEMRARVLPVQVRGGRMRQGVADEFMLRLECARDTLKWLQKNEARIKAALAKET